MRTPQQQQAIDLFGYSYSIDQSKTYDEIGAFGRYHSRLQKIQIAKDISNNQKESTLLHEVLHLISFHLQLDLSENQVAGLETGLYEFLQSNDIFSLNGKEKVIRRPKQHEPNL